MEVEKQLLSDKLAAEKSRWFDLVLSSLRLRSLIDARLGLCSSKLEQRVRTLIVRAPSPPGDDDDTPLAVTMPNSAALHAAPSSSSAAAANGIATRQLPPTTPNGGGGERYGDLPNRVGVTPGYSMLAPLGAAAAAANVAATSQYDLLNALPTAHYAAVDSRLDY